MRFAHDSRGVHKIHVTKVRSLFSIFGIDNCLFVISQGSSCKPLGSFAREKEFSWDWIDAAAASLVAHSQMNRPFWQEAVYQTLNNPTCGIERFSTKRCTKAFKQNESMW